MTTDARAESLTLLTCCTHDQGGFDHQRKPLYFLIVLETGSSRSRCQWLTSSEVSLVGLLDASFFLGPHLVFSLSAYIPDISSSFYKDLVQIGLGSSYMKAFAEGMASHSSILAWRAPLSTGLQRVRHN